MDPSVFNFQESVQQKSALNLFQRIGVLPLSQAHLRLRLLSKVCVYIIMIVIYYGMERPFLFQKWKNKVLFYE